MTKIDPSLIQTHYKLQNDFIYFANKALKIKAKSGKVIPFKINKAQMILHEKAEEQLKRIGKVRLIIVKGRQQGCSTYIGGRFYWKSTRKGGKNVFVLSHEAATTDKLFSMVKMYHEELHPALRPNTKYSSRKELNFDDIHSQYFIGTAGNKEVGRGGTIQLFHGSEAAFWKNTGEITSGLMQSIADMDDTEVFLESTANGMANYFHKMAMEAIKGIGEYELCFIPWFVQDEYRSKVPEDFKRTEKEEYLVKEYGLDDAQLMFRRNKIVELKSEFKFMQEYPCTVHEAFQTSGETLISSEDIQRARKANIKDKDAPLVMGVDPARSGDRTVIVFRRGREMLKPVILNNQKPMQIVGKVAKFLDKYPVKKCFIDNGYGDAIVDRLHELGYEDTVQGVWFNEGAIEDNKYRNKRTEIWCSLSEWLKGNVSIPDMDDIQADFQAVPREEETATGIKFLVPKKKIIEEYGQSPDIGDAAGLTFSYPVNIDARSSNIRVTTKVRNTNRLRRR